MRAVTLALNHYRLNERECLTELVSIRREIDFLLDFIDQSPSHRSLTPAVEDLRERETAIEKALQETILPPIPDELRNPFTKPRTPDEREYIKELVRRHDERCGKTIPAERRAVIEGE